MSTGKKGLPIWAWVLILLPVVVMALGITSALAIYGLRKYMMNAKQAEATAALTAWGDGLVRCAEQGGRLPQSAVGVPSSLDSVRGRKYQSSSSEWAQAAHTCAGFSFTTPQYFQYSWTLRSADAGLLEAVADLDGDGVPDSRVEASVTCGGGRCTHSAPLVVGSSDGTPGKKGPSAAALGGMLALGGIGLLGWFAAGIWVLVLAFQTSTGWGFVALLVPFGRLVFTVSHWEQAKRAFFLFLGSLALVTGAGVISALSRDAKDGSSDAAGTEPNAATGSSNAAVLGVGGQVRPLPAFDGSSLDVSSVMGRARKLAEEWERDATLLGVEATVLNGQVQPELGGTATVTFGPSRFASVATRTGLFVVTYDRSGIHGAPRTGKVSPALPEPRCSPEAALAGAAGLGAVPLLLRYGLDKADRPSWLVSVVSEPAQLRILEPDACSPRGTVVVRPR